jgi:hypothetical protein
MAAKATDNELRRLLVMRMRDWGLGLGFVLALTASGCAAQKNAAPASLSKAQVTQKLQSYAQDPDVPKEARDAAQHGLYEEQAEQMVNQGH